MHKQKCKEENQTHTMPSKSKNIENKKLSKQIIIQNTVCNLTNPWQSRKSKQEMKCLVVQ